MNAYSNDLRQKAIELYETEDYSKVKISQLLKISYKTIWSWIKLYEVKSTHLEASNTTGKCENPVED